MEKKLTLSDRLKYVLDVVGITQTELASRISVKPQIIQYLCTGNAEKSKFTFDIADALQIDAVWLATGKGTIPNKALSTKSMTIPLLTFNQIREWKVYGDTIDKDTILNRIQVNENTNTDSYAVTLNDRSMSPRFDLDTIVIIDPSIELSKSSTNLFVLVYLSDEDFVIFRKLLHTAHCSKILPLNHSLHKEIALNDKDKILGICTEARWSI